MSETKRDAIERSLQSWMSEQGIGQGMMLPGNETDVARYVEIGLSNWQHNQRMRKVPRCLQRFARIKQSSRRGWYYTPWTCRFGHGGWVFFDPSAPIHTLQWLWRFRRGPAGC